MTVKSKIAFLGSKSASLGLKIMKRNGTNLPGKISMKIDKNYINHVKIPKRSIAVTGTNGKTTTSNLILNILQQHFKTPIGNNSMGSNTLSGILTSLNNNITLFGKKKSDTFILEIDERFVPYTLPTLKPEVFTITNLYQDSYKRNAHPEFIRGELDREIPKETKILVNGDDLISSSIGEGYEKYAFGVDLLEGEVEYKDSKLKDIEYCPVCGEKLEWDFVRYHHIGRAHCNKCGFKNMDLTYRVISRDSKNMTFTLMEKDEKHVIPLILNTIETIYNQTAAFASLRQFGLSAQDIIKYMKNLKIVKSRFDVVKAKDRDVYLISAKNMNPIANSRVMQSVIENKNNPKKKTIVFCNDNSNPGSKYSELISWIYDADFEYLNRDDVDRIIFYNWKYEDMIIRMLLGGFDESKLKGTDNIDEVADLINLKDTGDIFILNDIEPISVKEANYLRNKIIEKIGGLK